MTDNGYMMILSGWVFQPPDPAEPGEGQAKMFPADRNPTPIAVEYDSRGSRTTHQFTEAYSARRFFSQKDHLGKNPKVLRSETMATKKAATKKTTKKAPVKKTTKKTTKKATAAKGEATPKAEKTGSGEYGLTRSADVAWTETKVKVLKALKSLGAANPVAARSAKDVAKKAGVPTHAVRHYCYHAAAAGLTGIAEVEGVRGYAFHLTAKGCKVNLDKVLG